MTWTNTETDGVTWVKTKVDGDLNKVIDQYKEQHNLNKVEAVRELLRQGAQIDNDE